MNPADMAPDRPPPDVAEWLDRSHEGMGRLATRVLYFCRIGSTNDVAAALARRGPSEGAVVWADEQTAGRGRRGHSWFSPPRAGLYVSVVLTPAAGRDARRATGLLTIAAGAALAEAVHAATGLEVDLEWPNDLCVGRRKLGGILAEAVTEAVVLGYGINVARTAYPPELGDRATSLEAELGRPVERGILLVESLAALARRYDDLLNSRFDAILDAWRRRAPASVGARVTWTDPSGRRVGVTAGVDQDGGLLVKVGDRVETIVAGEVHWEP